MAFGAGVLISAVAFESAAEAVQRVGSDEGGRRPSEAGCARRPDFFAGDWWIDRMGGADRKRLHQGQARVGAPARAGIVLDGIPSRSRSGSRCSAARA